MTLEQALQIETDCKRAYQLAFAGPAGAAVLIDLKPFCRAEESCAIPGDHDRTYLLEGRRECWLRIQDYLTLSPEDLVKKHTKHGATDEA